MSEEGVIPVEFESAPEMPKASVQFAMLEDEIDYLIGLMGKERFAVEREGGEFVAEPLLQAFREAKVVFSGQGEV